MKKKLYFIFFICSSALFADNWKLILSKDGVKVYSSATAGSNFYRFKGTGVINAPASKVFTIIQDVSKVTQWVEGSKNVKLLDKNFTAKSYDMKISQYYQVLYGQNSTPWPFQDRDYILKGRVNYNAKEDAAYIHLKNISLKSIPRKKDITRMKEMVVNFKIKPLENNKCAIEFIVMVDPGGYIPAWAVNFMAKNEPLKTIRKLRKLARSENYDKEIEKLVLFHMKNLRK